MKLHPLFTDHAVLCRGREIRVFGTAAAGETVTVTLAGPDGACLATNTCEARDGRFTAYLKPQEARTGCTLTAEGDGETEIHTDIAIGDVYLAGGQSNMELALCNADEGPERVARDSDPLLRWYNVPQRSVLEDAEEAEPGCVWQVKGAGNGADMSAVGYFFARCARTDLNVPVGVIDCYWGGSSITAWLDEEALARTAEGQRYAREYAEQTRGITLDMWRERNAAFQREMDDWNVWSGAQRAKGVTWEEINAVRPCPWHPPMGPGSPYRPAGLAETMLRRILPVAVTAALWYQGEEDTERTERYDLLQECLITRWRELLRDDELPFLLVQLPMWREKGVPETGSWPRLRMAQERVVRRVAHTGMAVMIDGGELNNIHPTDKRTVGERLWVEARRVVHGLPAPVYPRVVMKWTEGSVLTVRLSEPVTERPGDPLLEVAGEDGVWHAADAVLAGDLLRLSCPDVPRPVHARYAWVHWGKVPYFGESGLPLAPFEL